MTQNNDTVFISWIDFHGRTDGIARALGIESWSNGGGEGNILVRYSRLWRETRKFLKQRSPKTVIVMQPPVVALWAVRSVRIPGMRVAGDLHTGAFDDPKWKWATRSLLRSLRHPDLAIVTNEALAKAARKQGADALVLHDLIEDYPETLNDQEYDEPLLKSLAGKEFILVPLAYAYDEPLEALSSASHRNADIKWVFTGRAPDSFIAECNPDNSIFPGFVSRDDYLRLLGSSTVVIAPTTEENTMQRAGYEAMCASKALITSNTKVLRDFFDDAAIITDPTSDGFTNAVAEALMKQDELQEKIALLKVKRIAEQDAGLKQLQEWIAGE